MVSTSLTLRLSLLLVPTSLQWAICLSRLLLTPSLSKAVPSPSPRLTSPPGIVDWATSMWTTSSRWCDREWSREWI
ncbi:hypothetical protein BDY19DRAFT_973441 [Irpex rosettiformis]|uniref:Uncharacterized protein n=1 Tax=Irpex rosettiformis TaxID=378272 RepID=A0ACB8TQT8_9APHY|nr:hypothetical protein BDY19DRAFT_973441 [Irpex rosettiformis]